MTALRWSVSLSCSAAALPLWSAVWKITALSRTYGRSLTEWSNSALSVNGCSWYTHICEYVFTYGRHCVVLRMFIWGKRVKSVWIVVLCKESCLRCARTRLLSYLCFFCVRSLLNILWIDRFWLDVRFLQLRATFCVISLVVFLSGWLSLAMEYLLHPALFADSRSAFLLPCCNWLCCHSLL